MILSFHPCIVADENRICAGRKPDHQDQAAMRRAAAVILPQGCPQDLYHMARGCCRHVFPNYDARFAYPGKTGQARLFERCGAPCPPTAVLTDARDLTSARLPFDFPYMVKLDWGGEGRTTFPVSGRADLDRRLLDVLQSECAKGRAFVVQRFVPCGGRVLRVAVIGGQRFSYWRTLPGNGGQLVGLRQGAGIDRHADPRLQRAAVDAVDALCRCAAIDLAGFDLIFDDRHHPLFLEINYFFGRYGLGGSAAFYRILKREVLNWLRNRGIEVPE